MVQGHNSPSEKDLISLILEDIAAIHGVSVSSLRAEMVDYHAQDWYHDQYSQGAFALYGPGQFQELFEGVTRPAAGGYLYAGGEAASVHHAWVAGVLNSAWRCVAEILMKEGIWIDELKNLWPVPDEMSIELLVALGDMLGEGKGGD